MFNFKTLIFLSLLFFFFGTSCVLIKEIKQEDQPDSSKIAEEKIAKESAIEYYPEFKNVEDLMEYGLKRHQLAYRNQEVIKSLIQQKQKFRELAKSCSSKISPTNQDLLLVRGEFAEPIKIDNEHYIIELICGNHRVMSSFVFFLYTRSEGIQIKPLEFTVLDVGEHGQIYAEKKKILLGASSYDSTTQELTIKKICDYTGGHRSTLGKYKLENNTFEMVEFWLDTKKHTKCINPPLLERLYPQ